MQRFTELRVWQVAHALAIDVYKVSAAFPPGERFGLTAQLRRAVVSVSSNIAEGSKRRTRRDYARFLNLAEGSLAETESLLLLALDLGFAEEAVTAAFVSRIDPFGAMIATLRARVEAADAGEGSAPPAVSSLDR